MKDMHYILKGGGYLWKPCANPPQPHSSTFKWVTIGPLTLKETTVLLIADV